MKRLLLHFGLLAAAAGTAGVVFLLVLNGVVMPYVVDVPRVTVPRLRGQPVGLARRQLARFGLHLTFRDSLHDPTAPPGTVLGQDPSPGQRVKRGRRIHVDVSLGPKYYPVPSSLEGVSLREAQLQLEANQLRLGEVQYVSSKSVPAGAVIRSTPPGGAELPRGTLVDLEISNGRPDEPKTVPVVRGVSVADVEDSLRKYEMRLGLITTRSRPDTPAGVVLEQSPVGGARAARLTKVDLVISATPAPPNPVEQAQPATPVRPDPPASRPTDSQEKKTP